MKIVSFSFIQNGAWLHSKRCIFILIKMVSFNSGLESGREWGEVAFSLNITELDGKKVLENASTAILEKKTC